MRDGSVSTDTKRPARRGMAVAALSDEVVSSSLNDAMSRTFYESYVRFVDLVNGEAIQFPSRTMISRGATSRH